MSDYDHRFHAGNAGDVWKHVVWLAVLAAFKREVITVVDTHAGRGAYPLSKGGGEWLGGIGKLWDAVPADSSTGSGAVDRYLARVPRGERYPGSPALTVRALGRNDRLVAIEADDDAARALRQALGTEPRAQVLTGDGWTHPATTATTGGQRVALIDPPFVDREDWARTAALVATLAKAGAAVAAWYPIKRWSRPTALVDAVRATGVPFVAIDLVHTPIELAPNGLAGSGMVLAGVPRSVVIEAHAAAPVLGPILATTDGRWSVRTTGVGA
ncbi:MAG: 23S rRNA (adenine(2030)-N(6))-methyltransferase RlmJ [Myxococcota bacterium]